MNCIKEPMKDHLKIIPRGNKMKKILITLCLILFTSSAYAGSCPMIAKDIDSKIKKAQELRDQGVEAHKSGDHAKSEELLNQALNLFKS